MKKRVAVTFLFLTLSACSRFRQPTHAVIPTFTAVQMQEAISTQSLTSSPFPLSETPNTALEPVAEGQPSPEWKGIPIMPDAIAGEGDEEGYVFTINATPLQVQEYYQLELGERGWQLFSQESGGSSLTLIFIDRASATLTVNILSKGEEVLVLLVK